MAGIKMRKNSFMKVFNLSVPRLVGCFMGYEDNTVISCLSGLSFAISVSGKKSSALSSRLRYPSSIAMPINAEVKLLVHDASAWLRS